MIPTDDRRHRYASVLEQRARELTMPGPDLGRVGNGATMPELAEAVMAVADEELAELRTELEWARAAGVAGVTDPCVSVQPDLPDFPKGFRLHWRGQVLAATAFPSGHIVVVDDPEYRIVSGAATMRDLLLNYAGARLEWPAEDQGATDAQSARDLAYEERAHLLAWLATLYPAVIAPAPDIDEPGWQILYITPARWQASWHIHPRDADLFRDVEHVLADDPRAQWDGHTTAQKYTRIKSFSRILHISRRLAAARAKRKSN